MKPRVTYPESDAWEWRKNHPEEKHRFESIIEMQAQLTKDVIQRILELSFFPYGTGK